MLMDFSDPTVDPVRTFQCSVPAGSTVAPSDPLRPTGPAAGSRGERSRCSGSLQSVLSIEPGVEVGSHCEAKKTTI
jgi:hypothetical protein